MKITEIRCVAEFSFFLLDLMVHKAAIKRSCAWGCDCHDSVAATVWMKNFF